MIRGTVGFMLALCSITLSGQLIMESGDRKALLERLEGLVLAEVSGGVEGTARSPFREVPEAVEAAEVVEPVREWTEAMALEEIAKTFKPTGSLIKAGLGYLLVSGGRRLGEGEVFEALIGDQSFLVEVEAVSASTYRLRLGDSLIERTFEKEEGR